MFNGRYSCFDEVKAEMDKHKDYIGAIAYNELITQAKSGKYLTSMKNLEKMILLNFHWSVLNKIYGLEEG